MTDPGFIWQMCGKYTDEEHELQTV